MEYRSLSFGQNILRRRFFIMNDYIILITGIGCAGFGGDFFVRETIKLAHWARVSPGIVSATIAAFATSSAELSASINAAMAGNPQIALGNALGGNIFNSLFIIAVASIIEPAISGEFEVTVTLIFGFVSLLLIYLQAMASSAADEVFYCYPFCGLFDCYRSILNYSSQ
jgi:Ca2+/Na+ antiporter